MITQEEETSFLLIYEKTTSQCLIAKRLFNNIGRDMFEDVDMCCLKLEI